MAHIHRLIAFILLGISSAAYAALTPSYEWLSDIAPSKKFSSPNDVCIYAHGDGAGFSPVAQSNGSYRCIRSSDGLQGAFAYKGAASCPDNASVSGEDCACNAGYEEKDGQCKKKNPCPEGQHEEGGACVPDTCKPDEVRVNGLCVKEPECPAGQTRVNGVCKENGCEKGKNLGLYDLGTSGATLYLCENKCQLRVVAQFDITYTDADGKQITEYSGSGIQTGASCSGGSGGGGPSTSGPGSGGGPSDGGGGTGGGSGGGNGGTGGTGGTGGGGTGGGTGGGGNNNGGSSGGSGGGGTGGGGTGGGGTGGGGSAGGSGGGSSGSSLPGVQKPPGVDPGPNGVCPAGTSIGPNNRCFPTEPKDPDSDGKCSDGYVKVNNQCIPLVPLPSPGGGGGGGGGGGNGNGTGGNGDGDGEGSGFGGSCEAGFACDGDAIQCAIAREQHRRNCVMFNDPSDESRLYEANKDKEGDQTGDLPGSETVDIGALIDRSDALGGGSCFGDVAVTVWGRSMSLPFSQLCPYLAMLGNILLAVSALLSARIIARG
jgi:hypothetical protein